MDVDSPQQSSMQQQSEFEDFGNFGGGAAGPGAQAQDPEEVVDEEEEEEEDEEDDEEEEEEQGPARKKPKHKKKRRKGVNRFIDVEAEVDEDDEEEEDEEDLAANADFIVPGLGHEDEGEDVSAADKQNRQFERRQRKQDDRSAQQIAREIEEREKARRAFARDVDEMGSGPIPRNALAPDVNDPTIWAVKVRPGKERDLVFSVSKKAASQDLHISSAFQRDSIKGFVYIEARSESHVRQAMHGLVGVFASAPPLLIPLEDRTALLKTKQIQTELQIGGWARFKRGKHQGDIAQIIDVPDHGDDVTIKFVPRIDYAKKEEQQAAAAHGLTSAEDFNSKKRKKGGPVNYNLPGMRPPLQLFNPDDVKAAFGQKSVSYARGSFHFEQDEYKDGFCIKDVRLTALNTEDVQPSIDEIARFGSGGADVRKRTGAGSDDEDDGPTGAADRNNESAINLQLIAQAARRSANLALQPGDHVEVIEGGSKGLKGTVVSIVNEKVFITSDELAELREIEVLLSEIRKSFKIGDHVKVLAGANEGQTGLVLSTEGDTLSFMNDLTNQEIKVFSKDVREAAEVGSTSNTDGQYELHDLVQLDQQTAGCIFKIERDVLKILDQTRTVRTVRPNQILGKVPNTRKSVATDAEGMAINKGDNMKEVGNAAAARGEPRVGKVLHTYHSLFAFLFNRDYNETGGIFVVYAQQLTSETLRAKANVRDTTKMNPDAQLMPPPLAVAGTTAKPRRDRLLGQRIKIAGPGPQKGKEGRVKDVNPSSGLVRVELSATNQIVSIPRHKCMIEHNENGTVSMKPADAVLSARATNDENRGPRTGSGGGRFNSEGRTPNPWAGNGGKTANPYAAGSKTPNPYAVGGGKTPNPYTAGANGSGSTWAGGNSTYGGGAWDSGSQTPAYDGGAAWDSSSKTPYVNSMDDGSRTQYGGPSSSSYASAPTPAAGAFGGGNNSSSRDSWGPTPAAPQSAATPWAPANDAPTPSWSQPSARTPAAPSNAFTPAPPPQMAQPSAPTPGGQPYSAPTPAASGGFMNPERARQLAEASQSQTYEAPSPAFYDSSSYDAPQPPRGGGGAGKQQTGSNSGGLGAPRRWGNAGGAATNPTPAAPTPYASAATPGGDLRSAPTPAASSYNSAPTPAMPRGGPSKTPAASGSAATPFIPSHNAYTPAAGAAFDMGNISPTRPSGDAVPWNWPKAGMRAVISRAPDGEAVEEGDFDDHIVVVDNALPDDAAHETICEVHLLHSASKSFSGLSASAFLRPLRPESGGQCIILAGEHQGQLVKCVSHDDEATLVEFSNGVTDSVPPHSLCAC